VASARDCLIKTSSDGSHQEIRPEVGLRVVRMLVMVWILVIASSITQTISEADAQGAKGAGASQTEQWRRAGSEGQTGGEATTVDVRGNAVLVPVTIEHQGVAADVLLLLDTGSSRTVVSTDIARRLSINLAEARKVPMQVVGGGIIEARLVRLAAITVGPHTKKNADILVIQHAGLPVPLDGLLGMDLLRGLKYSIDFQKQLITWE